MKKIIYILLLSWSIVTFAQSNVKVIENQFLDYNQLIVKKDFSKALDQYAHEGFLKFVPKETMVLIFDKMFNDPSMKFTLEVPTILKVEEYPQKIQNVSYAKVFYSQKMSVELADVVNAKDAEEKQKNINLYLGAFKSQFGDGNVVFNEKNNHFEVMSYKMAVANSNEGKNWKFTVAEKQQVELLKQFLPEEILTDLK